MGGRTALKRLTTYKGGVAWGGIGGCGVEGENGAEAPYYVQRRCGDAKEQAGVAWGRENGAEAAYYVRRHVRRGGVGGV